MYRMFQLPQASAELCFEGGEIHNARKDHPDVIVWAERSGILVVVPDFLSEDDIEDITFHLTEVLGFKELDKEAIEKRPRCEIIPCVRGFMLTPDMLHKSGQDFFEIGHDLEELQRQFSNNLDILILSDGSYLVCLSNNLKKDGLVTVTRFLRDYLEATPQIIDLRKCS